MSATVASSDKPASKPRRKPAPRAPTRIRLGDQNAGDKDAPLYSLAAVEAARLDGYERATADMCAAVLAFFRRAWVETGGIGAEGETALCAALTRLADRQRQRARLAHDLHTTQRPGEWR